MRLLIVTQAVDQKHPVLGFFHEWIEQFARICESVEVICLAEGTHALPPNVRVHSLGKEQGRRSPLSYTAAFLALVWKLRGSYDAVFVHMNPEYLVVAGWLWRLLRKPVGLWYLHRSVTLRLRIAILFATYVFTATDKSMRVETHKKRVVGHGLSTEDTALAPAPPDDTVALLTVGRLSPVKRVELLIEALALLPPAVTLTIVGGADGPEAVAYAAMLRHRVLELGLDGRVRFMGARPHRELEEWYRQAHLFVHASGTGSLDKVLLEALARGIPVVTTNHELAQDAGEPIARFSPPVPDPFARAIEAALADGSWQDAAVRERARAYVVTRHDLARLVPTIVEVLRAPKG